MRYFKDQKEAEDLFDKLAAASCLYRVIHVVVANKDEIERIIHDMKILLQDHKIIALPRKINLVGGSGIPSRTLIFHSQRELMRTKDKALQGIAQSAIIKL